MKPERWIQKPFMSYDPFPGPQMIRTRDFSKHEHNLDCSKSKVGKYG